MLDFQAEEPLARPPSWLPRLPEIRRSVAGSVRSHYDRHDLEQLFELEARAWQKLLELLELLPTTPVGTAKLVERDALANFLNGVQADDVLGYIERVRNQGAEVSHRKIRSLVRADIAPATLTSLPDSMSLSRGRLEISFRTVKELADAMLMLARVLEAEGEEFAESFDIHPCGKGARRSDGYNGAFQWSASGRAPTRTALRRCCIAGIMAQA